MLFYSSNITDRATEVKNKGERCRWKPRPERVSSHSRYKVKWPHRVRDRQFPAGATATPSMSNMSWDSSRDQRQTRLRPPLAGECSVEAPAGQRSETAGVRRPKILKIPQRVFATVRHFPEGCVLGNGRIWNQSRKISTPTRESGPRDSYACKTPVALWEIWKSGPRGNRAYGTSRGGRW